jgi:aspartokinase-like uncharacterized kinase
VNRSLAVVKVGGSLYDLPDLGPRLRAWLERAPASDVLLVPGGGPTADLVRDFDAIHRLGERRAHWLALRALAFNAHFLAELLPLTGVIGPWEALNAAAPESAFKIKRTSILDPYLFAAWDGRANPDAALPPCWAVTSDSIAARAAVVYDADHLILLKSVTVPEGMGWEEAGERGLVDAWFARTLRPALPRLQVRAVNFREWRP